MRKKIKKGSQNSIQRGMAFATVLLCGALFAGCGAKTKGNAGCCGYGL